MSQAINTLTYRERPGRGAGNPATEAYCERLAGGETKPAWIERRSSTGLSMNLSAKPPAYLLSACIGSSAEAVFAEAKGSRKSVKTESQGCP